MRLKLCICGISFNLNYVYKWGKKKKKCEWKHTDRVNGFTSPSRFTEYRIHRFYFEIKNNYETLKINSVYRLFIYKRVGNILY